MENKRVCPDCMGTKVIECQGSIKECIRCFGTGEVDSTKGYAIKSPLPLN